MAATSVRVDGPAEWDAGRLGHAIDDRLGPDLVERDPAELRGVESANDRALLEEGQGHAPLARSLHQPEVVPAHRRPHANPNIRSKATRTEPARYHRTV